MKVLLVSSSDAERGAPRAAFRIHQAVIEVGLQSQMIVKRPTTGDTPVMAPPSRRERMMASIKPLIAT
jgi:hypothetical protein